MSFSKSNYFVFLIVIIGILAFFIRLESEKSYMNSKLVDELVSSGDSYETQISLNSDPRSSNYMVEAIGSDHRLDKRVQILSTSETRSLILGLEVGESIQAIGYLKSLDEYKQYLKNEHVVGIFVVEHIDFILPNSNHLNFATQALRDTIQRGCSVLGSDERGVCEGLLIGKRNSINQDLYSTYRESQLTHLLVASGSNIAFLIGFLKPLLTKLNRNCSSISIVLIAIFYCAVTRFEPSILRASVMVVIPAVLAIRGIEISRIKVFGSTLLVCTLLDPFLIFRVGFWLSLFASGGLVFVSPKLQSIIKSEIVRNTISATICVQPILWLVFGFQPPLRWWASVLGVAIAETIATFGMIIVVLTSFLDQNSVLVGLGMFPMRIGCKLLNQIATIGASKTGNSMGYFVTVYFGIYYALKYKRIKSGKKI